MPDLNQRPTEHSLLPTNNCNLQSAALPTELSKDAHVLILMIKVFMNKIFELIFSRVDSHPQMFGLGVEIFNVDNVSVMC